MKNVVRKTDVIYIDKNAFIYLKNYERASMGLDALPPERYDRTWERAKRDEFYKVIDKCSFAIGDGVKNGRVRLMAVDEAKSILNEAGFKYTEGEPTEVVDVYI